MQYPVPQFTDVEDKIIGSLTIKQFGILFGAGIVIFLAYSTSKSILVAVFFFVLVGIPALAIAFAKINGRPLYKTFPVIYKFITAPKILIFHKEVNNFNSTVKFKNIEIEQKTEEIQTKTKETTKQRLVEVNRLLEQQAQEQEMLYKNQKP